MKATVAPAPVIIEMDIKEAERIMYYIMCHTNFSVHPTEVDAAKFYDALHAAGIRENSE